MVLLRARRPFRHPTLAVAILCVLLVPELLGQGTATDSSTQLQGKPLFLRGMWNGQDLHFDCAGNPAQSYPKLPFTEAGIDIHDVKLQSGVLEMRGDRIGLVYDSGSVPRRVKMHWPKGGSVRLHVTCAPGADFRSALDSIFAPDLSSLVPAPAGYWALLGNALLAQAGGAALGGAELAKDIETPGPEKDPTHSPFPEPQKLKPPRLLASVDPRYSEAALTTHVGGTVEIYLWVLPSGEPAHLRVVKPLGMGLDEQALAAVARYRFSPATKDGVPVEVDLYVDVNFKPF